MKTLNRRSFLKGIGAGAASLSWPSWKLEDGDGDKRPNILLILADDLGTECLGCYRGLSYQTPNLDAMAQRGVLFQNAYATPLCSPSRVQLMTGQYPFRSGWDRGIWEISREKQLLKPDRPNFANVLKKAGYATAVAGKWQLARFDDHPDHPVHCGFDEYCLWRWVDGETAFSRYWSPGIWQNGKPLENTDGRYGPDIFCDYLSDFIRRNKSKPFFAYYSMVMPHEPFVLPPGHGEDHRTATDPGPMAQKNFGAMVEYMDGLVGKLLRVLDELELRRNTMVLFLSDNGSPPEIISRLKNRSVSGGKFGLTEAGTRIPLIIDGPDGVVGSRACEDLVDLSDILPTLADLSGAEIPKGAVVDGRSFLPQLQGKPGDPRKWIFCQLHEDWYLRDKKYRLMRDGKLFNMQHRYFPRVLTDRPGPEAAAAKARLAESAGRLMENPKEPR